MDNWENLLGQALQGQDKDRLANAREESLRELQATRSTLSQSLAAESESVTAQVVRERALVEDAFQDFFHLLGLCQAYLQDGQTSWLTAARDNYPNVSARLNLALASLREAVFAERGPFTHPGLNRLLQAVAGGSLEDYQAARALELARVEALWGEDEMACKSRQALLRAELSAYEAYSDLLDSAPDEVMPDQAWHSQAAQVGQQLARCDREFVARRSAGPTCFPALNAALNSVWLHQQDRIEAQLPQHFIVQACLALDDLAHNLEPIPEAAGALAILDDILERLQQLKNLPPDATTTLCPQLIDLARAYEEQFKALRQPDVLCGVCGRKAPAGQRRCDHCGTRL